jgi:phospholipase C
MPPDLDMIERIVVILMENRSFDHQLGYLSLDPVQLRVNGLRSDPAWVREHANPFLDEQCEPFRLKNPAASIDIDPPHDYRHIATQLKEENGAFTMKGFVESCSAFDPDRLGRLVMGYYTGADLPVSHAFATQYAVCDRWFCSLPASTQPNRLMAMSGFSRIADNVTPLPPQELVYDWLDRRKIPFRVYHAGLPFFTLMLDRIPTIATSPTFRDLDDLRDDFLNEDDDEFPPIIFVEPVYSDAPLFDQPSDDHAPTPVAGGQKFLAEVYSALTANPDRWAHTVVVVTYDEHGGFFDHVPPPRIVTPPPPKAYYRTPFQSLGARVPAYVVSPFVSPGHVYSQTLDHTSILKFIGKKFGDQGYSPEVDARGVGNVYDVLDLEEAREDIPGIPVPGTTILAPRAGVATPQQQAFEDAWEKMKSDHPEEALRKFPKLMQPR